MNLTQRVRTQRPATMTHDDVIQMITVVNVPRSATTTVGGATSWKRSGQQLIRKSGVRSAARCRDMMAAAYDDEAARTRKYWENFAREATRELLKDSIKPEVDSAQQRIMYSGRVGIEPKYPPKIADGDESTATDLSLLTCSELAPSGGKGSERRRRRQRRTIEPDADSKTNWAEAVKDSYGGVLGRMLEKDAGTLHVFTNGGASGYSVLNKANISKLFSEEEQRLLMKSAYMRGTHGNKKSASTENIVTAFAAKREFGAAAGFRNAPTSSGETCGSRSPNRSATKRSVSVPSEIHAVAARGRRSSERKSRPRSIFGADQAGTGYPSVTAVTRDSESDYSRHLHAQIYTTVTALDRIAGLGDKTSELNTIPEEKGLYTDGDYARVPRYPQNIRVAPQLVHVITSEVKKRVSQPRRYELRQQDVYRFDRMQPSLDRASRNLFIFNWLNQLNERHFRAPPFPELRSDAGDDVTEIVFSGSMRSQSDETGSNHGQARFDDESFASSDVSYDDGYDVDSYGPAIGSLSDHSV